MATVGNTFPTLADIAKKLDPNGSIANVAEVLQKTNPLLDDIAWKEGNLPTGHRYTSRTALPTPTWRRFNEGVAPSKSATDPVDETCGMLDALAKIDSDEANLNGNAAAFRADEDKAFLQGFNQEVARALFYENVVTNPARIQGLTPRMNATASNPASAQIIKGDNVTSASGSDQTSIWLVGWSPETVFGIYPKGSKAGLDQTDLGLQLTKDANNNEFTAWVTKYSWKLGLCVRDYRYLSRICNIDTSATKADLSAGCDMYLALMDAIASIYDISAVSPVLYMNRWSLSMFNKQMAKKGTVNLLEYIEKGGRRLMSFMGIPIRVTDALTSTEAIVT